jgi:hypothetical protein
MQWEEKWANEWVIRGWQSWRSLCLSKNEGAPFPLLFCWRWGGQTVVVIHGFLSISSSSADKSKVEKEDLKTRRGRTVNSFYSTFVLLSSCVFFVSFCGKRMFGEKEHSNQNNVIPPIPLLSCFGSSNRMSDGNRSLIPRVSKRDLDIVDDDLYTTPKKRKNDCQRLMVLTTREGETWSSWRISCKKLMMILLSLLLHSPVQCQKRNCDVRRRKYRETITEYILLPRETHSSHYPSC